jgi:hypothetical protein
MAGRVLSRLLQLCTRSCACTEQVTQAQLSGIAGSIQRLERGVASSATADRQAWLAGNRLLGLNKRLTGASVSDLVLVSSGQAAAAVAAVAPRQHKAVQWQSQRGCCEGDLRVV